ncbi:MAG: glycosyltransferase [Crocinitomicaceae bacterium]
MKLFVLLSRFPYPLEKGDKLRAYHQIRLLSQQHEIHLCCLSDQKVTAEWRNELAPYCASIHVLKLRKILIYLNTFLQLFTDKPYQVGYFYQSPVQRKINQLISTIHPDHIYCQLIRTTEYVKNIHNIPKTLDYQDALSKGMFRRAEISRGSKKQLFRAEGKRLSEYENRIFDFFNHHTIISEQDRDFINHPSKDRIEVIKNGIAESFFNYDMPSVKTHQIVFTGNMNYPPNIECAEFLVNEILPLLEDDVRILLSGASPHQRVLQLASKKVEVTGWVDDIRESYARAELFVAPLFIGTGLQNKLLEAMAMGIPSITTPLTNSALGASPDQELLIAENASQFAEQINRLLNNKKLYGQVQLNAKKFVRENFSWEKSVKQLAHLIQS